MFESSKQFLFCQVRDFEIVTHVHVDAVIVADARVLTTGIYVSTYAQRRGRIDQRPGPASSATARMSNCCCAANWVNGILFRISEPRRADLTTLSSAWNPSRQNWNTLGTPIRY